MNTIIKTIGSAIMGVGLLIGGLFGHHVINDPSIGATQFNPTGGQTYRLQSTIGSSQTTVTLTSFKEPVSNIPYTMSYLNSSIEYGTLSPQTTVSEFISFTGITQNTDGTATLTGVVRGLSRSYPYTASTTLAQPHSGQSIFILSDTPQLFNQYYVLQNNATSTGILTFSSTTPPRYDSVGAQAAGTYLATTSEFASIAYVNATGAGVNVNSTETVKGVVELATQLESASSTATGGTGAGVVLQAKYATSSPYTAGLYIPVTRNDGKLTPNFIATTSADTYNWGGNNSYTGTSLFTGSPTFNSASTFNVAPTFGTFSATSSLVTSTSTIAGNLTVAKNASTTNLTVSGSCTGCVNPTIVSNAFGVLDGGSPSKSTQTATCTGIQKVSGGGINSPIANLASGQNVISYPSSATVWTGVVYGANGSTANPSATVYAVCVNP